MSDATTLSEEKVVGHYYKVQWRSAVGTIVWSDGGPYRVARDRDKAVERVRRQVMEDRGVVTRESTFGRLTDLDELEKADQLRSESGNLISKSQLNVTVGNIGNVYDGDDEKKAREIFEEYKKQSRAGYGRAAYEDVCLFRDGHAVMEARGEPASWRVSLELAQEMMYTHAELEPTSALKEAASSNGVAWGDDMGHFVKWANLQWNTQS